MPVEPDEKPHVFVAPLANRRERGHDATCEACDRTFGRAEGVAGAWRFSYSIREVAMALVRGGRKDSYRKISAGLRAGIGRSSSRGRRKGETSTAAGLVMSYIDTFGPAVIGATAPGPWPREVYIDAWPVRIADHTECCGWRREKDENDGARPPRSRHMSAHARDHMWYPPADHEIPMVFPAWETGKLGATLDELSPELREQAEKALAQWDDEPDDTRRADGTLRTLKIKHTAEIREIGRILVAVGRNTPSEPSRPWLIRFMGAGDQTSWAEFLRSLPGAPAWVVSDRDSAIIPAVAAAWPDAAHYHCEQHIAENMADKARLDGITAPDDPVWGILEDAQHSELDWAAAEGAAAARGATELLKWLVGNRDLLRGQLAKRQAFPLAKRSAGACETVIREIRQVIEGREHRFRNADRLDLLLALIRNEIDNRASVAGYVRVIRTVIDGRTGRAGVDWKRIRDRGGVSSMEVLLADAKARASAATTRRHAPTKAAAYYRRREKWAAERKARGLPEAPRGHPRAIRAQGSVAGKHVSDYWWLEVEWHGEGNPGLSPETMPAGSGAEVVWQCRLNADHVWPAQVRSRSIRGAGCPYCSGRRTVRSQSLAVTHPDIAAQWHPTRNGDRRPDEVSFGSHHEAWWQCPAHKGHVWRSRVASRTSMVTGCPLCGRLRGKGGRPRADAEANAVA